MLRLYWVGLHAIQEQCWGFSKKYKYNIVRWSLWKLFSNISTLFGQIWVFFNVCSSQKAFYSTLDQGRVTAFPNVKIIKKIEFFHIFIQKMSRSSNKRWLEKGYTRRGKELYRLLQLPFITWKGCLWQGLSESDLANKQDRVVGLESNGSEQDLKMVVKLW